MSLEVTDIEKKIAEDTLPPLPPIPPLILQAFKKANANNNTHHTLDLSHMRMDIAQDELIQYILFFLQANPTITHLIIRTFMRPTVAQLLSQISTLHTLDLAHTNIGATGAEALAQSTTLQTLNIAYNGIGDRGAEALSKNTILLTLNVEYNLIGDIGTEALAQNTTLQNLNLSGNHIKTNGIQALACNTTLKYLQIAFCFINDAGANMLSKNTTLLSVDLSRNPIANNITLEMNILLQINAERATPKECIIITQALEYNLIQHLIPLVLEYRGKQHDYFADRHPIQTPTALLFTHGSTAPKRKNSISAENEEGHQIKLIKN